MNTIQITILGLFLVGFLIFEIAELRRHRMNTLYLDSIGGDVVLCQDFRSMYRMFYIVPLIGVVEGCINPFQNNRLILAIGVLCVTSGFFLRVSAFSALGEYWSRSLRFVRGASTVRHGPYRFLGHPEYLGRMIEVLGILIVAYAPLTMLILTPTLIFRYLRTIVVEQSQIDALSEPARGQS
ncbi:MAG: hypothetical protein HRU19_14730 [Pseudobacteriovorax sp.]|nr:hypothetical protein [Pseudobacteriovorax sp.]